MNAQQFQQCLRVLVTLVRGNLNNTEWENRLFENDWNVNDWNDMAYALTGDTRITDFNAILTEYKRQEPDQEQAVNNAIDAEFNRMDADEP